MIPNCPTHGVPMKPSSVAGKPGFYCSQKDPSKSRGFCTEFVPAGGVRVPATAGLPVSVGAGPSQSAANTILAAAALYFCTVTGQGLEQAESTYNFMKRVAQ